MRLLLIVLLTFVSPSLLAQAAAWGDLKPGPHGVGYTQLERYDHSRVYRTARSLDGKPRTGERARPIRISVWYPAQASAAKPLTLGDYLDMLGGETHLGATTAAEQKGAEEAFFLLPLLNTLTEEQRAAMRPLAGRARRDAKPVEGRFPLILYSLGSTAIAHVTPEYLASHGYVVVQSPRLGAYAGMPADSRDALDLDMKLRDMDVLLNAMRDWKQADLANIATIGFSAGGRWALAAAMKNPDVKAVISLDSAMLFNDPINVAWRAMPHFDLAAVRVPVLHLTRKEFADQDDAKMWEAMRFSDRNAVVYEAGLDHWDFQSLGYATALVGARGDVAPRVKQIFHAFHRETLAFLDAHLKGASYTPPKGQRIAAEKAPISVAELMNAIAEDGADVAVEAFRKEWKSRGEPPVAEAALNVAGYTLLFGGRAAEGLRVLALNAEAYPTSANTYDSLADAYLAMGERAKALELTKKAAEMLAKETTLTPERKAAIQGSIDGKLRQLEK